MARDSIGADRREQTMAASRVAAAVFNPRSSIAAASVHPGLNLSHGDFDEMHGRLDVRRRPARKDSIAAPSADMASAKLA